MFAIQMLGILLTAGVACIGVFIVFGVIDVWRVRFDVWTLVVGTWLAAYGLGLWWLGVLLMLKIAAYA